MSDDESFSTFSLYVGADTWVACHHYPAKTPILVVDVPGMSVSISVRGREATESALAFARSLAQHAQAFAAEVERLHAEQAGAVPAKPAEQAA
jgi:hypothetical protein